MIKNGLLTAMFCCVTGILFAQNDSISGIEKTNKIELKAVLDTEKHQLKINQTLTYFNTTTDTLYTVFLNDWAHSYATKNTPLATRFAEEFNTIFHFAKNEDRGYTVITSLTQEDSPVVFARLSEQIDVLKVTLNKPLLPGSSYTLKLNYIVQLPNDKFTKYGRTADNNYNLRYWYIVPAIYNGSWKYQSNKDLDDLFIPPATIEMELTTPKNYISTSELNLLEQAHKSDKIITRFSGENRKNTRLFLNKSFTFKEVKTDTFTLVTDLDAEGLTTIEETVLSDRVIRFINQNLPVYPHEKLLVADIDYKKNPIYGLNLLPGFIRPFADNFQYELKLLKTALQNYFENTLLINPREEQWMLDGLQVYYMIKYVETFYPNTKLLGSLASIWGIRSFHASSLDFNTQYQLGYMHMARTNRDQPLSMQKDSLLKFNANIANKYKAGIGFKYLDDFINENTFENTVKSFLAQNQLKETSTQTFETLLKANTDKNIDWFFKEYIHSRKKIDFRIKKVRKTHDSITLTLQNKRHNNMPVSLFKLFNDSVISKQWIENIKTEKTITIPREEANKLVLNYDNTIPEYNLRDNWKSLKGFFFNNKPFQFRLFKDIEDPYYNQVFLMPLVEFRNIYDGLSLGTRIHNKTLLRKKFNYSFSPQYGTQSNTLTGSGSIYQWHNVEDRNLFFIYYGMTGSYQSYAENLFVRKLNPTLSFGFRDKNDFRSNIYHTLDIKYLLFNRDKSPVFIQENDEPNYSVFNIRYTHSDENLIDLKKWFVDFQTSKTFGKIAFNYQIRHLYESNRQFSFRFFAGAFLYNTNPSDFNYFSFALDRPTDYLFEYAYLGRSESAGIFSQQLILAEGGFKSKLQPGYANQWITTVNLGTSIWRYFQLYGDIGVVKNKNQKAKFVYDSGLRLNLVQDYFEVYFPVYSNLGWEIGQPNYDQKIRFIFTVDPQALLGLFRRKWY